LKNACQIIECVSDPSVSEIVFNERAGVTGAGPVKNFAKPPTAYVPA
jgi:hypothetical protein